MHAVLGNNDKPQLKKLKLVFKYMGIKHVIELNGITFYPENASKQVKNLSDFMVLKSGKRYQWYQNPFF